MRRILLTALLVASACGGGRPTGTVVSFITKDGFTVTGEEYGSGAKAVVLADGRADWAPFADGLARQGYHVLTVDLRPGSPATADRDVAAAADYLALHGAAGGVLLVGSGPGGVGCIEAAGRGTRAIGVATVAAGPEGPPLGSEVATIAGPKLFMVAEGDTAAVALAEHLLQITSEPRDVKTYPGSARGVALLDSGTARNDLTAFVRVVLP